MISPLTRKMLFMLSGWLIWSSCFVALYAGVYLGCEYMTVPADQLSGLNAMLALIWLVHLAILLPFVWRSWTRLKAHAGQQRNERPFIPTITFALNTTALVGTVWVGIPVIMIPPCP